MVKQLLHSWYIAAFHVPVVPELVWRTAGSWWPAYLRRVEGVRRPGHPAATVARDAARGLSLYRANFRPRLGNPRERRTEVPVLVIALTEDRYVTPATTEGLDRWVSRLSRRRLFAGHWSSLLGEGASVARMIGELIDDVRGKP